MRLVVVVAPEGVDRRPPDRALPEWVRQEQIRQRVRSGRLEARPRTCNTVGPVASGDGAASDPRRWHRRLRPPTRRPCWAPPGRACACLWASSNARPAESEDNALRASGRRLNPGIKPRPHAGRAVPTPCTHCPVTPSWPPVCERDDRHARMPIQCPYDCNQFRYNCNIDVSSCEIFKIHSVGCWPRSCQQCIRNALWRPAGASWPWKSCRRRVGQLPCTARVVRKVR